MKRSAREIYESIDHLLIAGEICKNVCPNFTAYFDKKNQPKNRLYLSNGKVCEVDAPERLIEKPKRSRIVLDLSFASESIAVLRVKNVGDETIKKGVVVENRKHHIFIDREFIEHFYHLLS